MSGGSSAITLSPEVLYALKWEIGEVVEVYKEEQKTIIKRPS
jgi:antitoxin component of MazEF toxin-antitoxin module